MNFNEKCVGERVERTFKFEMKMRKNEKIKFQIFAKILKFVKFANFLEFYNFLISFII